METRERRERTKGQVGGKAGVIFACCKKIERAGVVGQCDSDDKKKKKCIFRNKKKTEEERRPVFPDFACDCYIGWRFLSIGHSTQPKQASVTSMAIIDENRNGMEKDRQRRHETKTKTKTLYTKGFNKEEAAILLRDDTKTKTRRDACAKEPLASASYIPASCVEIESIEPPLSSCRRRVG